MANMLRFPRINTMMLSGRLTRDVDLRYTPKGMPVANISLAFDRSYKDDQGQFQTVASFIDVIAWSKTAEIAAEQLKKGSPVLVEGYLQTRNYTDNNNVNRKVVEIVANKIHPLERQGNSYPDGAHEEAAPVNPALNEYNPSSYNSIDDDVPF